MNSVLVLGAGKIGSLIGCLLAETGEYLVQLADKDPHALKLAVADVALPNLEVCKLDAQDQNAMQRYVSEHRLGAIISSLPYYCNPQVAEQARESQLCYFDLTEDREVTARIRAISAGAKKAFIPQCGLAPGFISIVATTLIGHFESVETVKMRVGALPVNPSNALKYSLTWSTDGLINEYGNLCDGIENWSKAVLQPLEGYETIEVDGLLYEAFNTSGGLGTLADTYVGKVKTMNYKTLRYPGHCEKIQLLMKELKLNENRGTLKRILERAIPKTLQDVVLIYVAVSGRRRGELFEETYVKKLYPQTLVGKQWSAIQSTTAAGICAIVDLVLGEPGAYQGFVTQETFSLKRFLKNRFGKLYA